MFQHKIKLSKISFLVFTAALVLAGTITFFPTLGQADTSFFLNCRQFLDDLSPQVDHEKSGPAGDPRVTDRELENISPKDPVTGESFPGSVIAAKKTNEPPNYGDFHWVRDAGLVMMDIMELFREQSGPYDKRHAFQLMKDYVTRSLQHQNELSRYQYDPNNKGIDPDGNKIIEEPDPEKRKFNPFVKVFEGYGEPKKMRDGKSFTGDWGRPQSDGPAFRALAMIPFAEFLMTKGSKADREYAKTVLYDSKHPLMTTAVIKRDLEYILHNWSKSSFDWWEERFAKKHFPTLMVQRKALLAGAELAERMRDPGAAKAYREGAQKIKESLQEFRIKDRGSKNYVVATIGYQHAFGEDNPNPGRNGLDGATLLGSLYGSTDDTFPPSDDDVLATVVALEKDNRERHPINKVVDGKDPIDGSTVEAHEPMAVFYGRYPEDFYDGDGKGGGAHPWVLITFGAAEHAYRVADEIQTRGSIEITEGNIEFYKMVATTDATRDALKVGLKINGGDALFQNVVLDLIKRGDRIVKRLKKVQEPNGEWAEQLDRNDHGKPRSARSLTWNYVAYHRALRSRRDLMKKMTPPKLMAPRKKRIRSGLPPTSKDS